MSVRPQESARGLPTRQEEFNKSLVERAFQDVFASDAFDEGAIARYFSPRYVQKTDGRTLALFLATKNSDPTLALQLAEAELRVRGDVYTDDALAWALYRNGRFPEANTAISRATRLGTRDARLVYHEGAIRLAMGDAAHGRELVRRALAMNPHFDATGAVEAAALVKN